MHTTPCVTLYKKKQQSSLYNATGCLNDMRYNNEWFPMVKEENGDSKAADLVAEQDTASGCADPAVCGTAAGPTCLDPLICRDVWRLAICEYVNLHSEIGISHNFRNPRGRGDKRSRNKNHRVPS